ncbi:acetyl-CoA synthetase-like protein [Pluteus cervinus]|uniref:Acetyl-CoA synthetase-like protein n=1 Tax=Pluteus cervinus TaxID=181527 RepID=A0ACD3B1B6_9AGAR|nr:acetyl-CoA synthetase-like protein [Pluteus cervinus]
MYRGISRAAALQWSRHSTTSRALSLSSVEGSLEPPLSTQTLPSYFETNILGPYASRPALICRQERTRAHGGPASPNLNVTTHLAWDFQEFDRHIHALARGLLTIGVKKGDRVAVIMGNTSAYAMLQWACASVGAILVTVNPAYRLPELVGTLKLVGVRHLFVVPRIRTSGYVEMFASAFPDLRNSAPGEIQEPELPELRNLVIIDNEGEMSQSYPRLEVRSAIDWREIMFWREDTQERRQQKDISATLKNDEVMNLQFTSGTTGYPKAVSLTHSNLLNNALSIGKCMRLTEKDILCNVPPLFHSAWTHGSCIVYPSEAFNPEAIVDAVVDERCTALHGVPTHFLGVLAEVERRQNAGIPVDTSSLRTGIAAGSPIPIDLMKRLAAKLNLTELTNAYGMTETSPVSFQTTPADSIIKRVETVGRVQPHARAKLIDPEGNIVPIGVPGEVCVSGYLVQKGYWEDEEQTRLAMKKDEGGTLWMHTGDEGIMDEEGYLRVVSRIKDIIIRGGENLFPVQIENALTAHPHIREAAVVCVPDATYGEVVGAWIVREPGSNMAREEVRRSVTENMNPQNGPVWVWFLGEDGTQAELPKTASGKVMKHVLRDWSRDFAKNNVGRV